MINMAKGTSLTGCWLKQANGQGVGQIDRQQLAQRFAEVGFDDPRSLMLAPFEIMRIQMEAIMLREWDIARGICTKSAKKADDVYLGNVERLEGTVKNTVDRIYKSEQ